MSSGSEDGTCGSWQRYEEGYSGAALVPVLGLWEPAAKALGVRVKHGAEFVEKAIEKHAFTVYVDDEHTGLWRPATGDVRQMLLDMWNCASTREWSVVSLEVEWEFMRLTPEDAEVVIEQAKRIGGRTPSPQKPPTQGGALGYLDPDHPRYAPKLAAAVSAWLAVEDPQGRAPKQALMKWLNENSARFGLSDEDGKPNNSGIEECAKVANWQPGGGAPKTPGP